MKRLGVWLVVAALTGASLAFSAAAQTPAPPVAAVPGPVATPLD